MEITQITYFKTVARLEHITKAAEQLHIAQPSLSRSISKLEEEIGVRLFERDGNKITLNEYGRCFLKYADQILLLIHKSVSEVRDLAGDTNGSVLVALSIPSIINRFLQDYMVANPNIFIHQFAKSPLEMKAALEDHEIDMAISAEPIDSQSILWHPLFQEEMLLIVSKEHPMADKQFISLGDFSNERFICNNSGSGIKETLEGFCKQAGFTPHIVFEGNEPVMVGNLVTRNYGVNMVPHSITRWAEKSVHGPSLETRILRIKNPICMLNFGVATLKGHYLSKAAIHFRNNLISYFKDYDSEQE